MDCGWRECSEKIEGDPKAHLLKHIEDEKDLRCFWAGCPRHGEVQLNKHSLLAHVRRHTGEKPFQCTLCGKEYTRADPLRKHLARHKTMEAKNEGLLMRIEYLSTLLSQHRRETKSILHEIQLTRENIGVMNAELLDILLDLFAPGKHNSTLLNEQD
jgi:krueppel-like factor 8/12